MTDISRKRNSTPLHRGTEKPAMLGQRRDAKGKYVLDISNYFLSFIGIVEKAWFDLAYLMQCTTNSIILLMQNPKDHKLNLNTSKSPILLHPTPHSAC